MGVGTSQFSSGTRVGADGRVSRGAQGAGLRPRPMAQAVMGVMLQSQLEQAAGFLDQQINLGRAGTWTGESQVVASRHEGTTSNPACQTWDPHLVQGHVPDVGMGEACCKFLFLL